MLADVLEYEGFYFKDNGMSEVAYKYTRGFEDISYGADPYVNALLLSEKIEKAETRDQIVETVKDGFLQRVLTGNNSFIVLETKEQEDELHRRNQEFLTGKSASAAPPASMDEPGALIAVLLTVGLLAVMQARKRRRDRHRADTA